MVWHPAFALLAFLLLLFPHGRLPSPRWRPFAWFVVAVYLVLSLSAAVAPGAVELYHPQPQRRRCELPVAGAGRRRVRLVCSPASCSLLVIALVSVVLRLRRAPGEERQQVKWFVYTVVTVIVVFVAGILVFGAGVLFPLFGLIPVSVAVAVFKYRLYDIDRLINRTLVYGLLTALLIGGLRRPGVPARAAAQPGHRRLGPGRGRLHPGRGRPVPAGPPPGPGSWSTGASTAAATTPPGRWSASAAASATRSTSTPSRPSCWRVVDQTVQPVSASLWLRSG